MSKHKFKVGDFVKLKKNVKPGDSIDGYTILSSMYKDLQKSRQIKAIIYLSGQGINVAKINGWYYPFNALEFATAPEKIIIYRNGSEVIAKNTLTGKTGVAKCNPADEFDFNTEAKLAFDRLVEPEPEKPEVYNGKVVCVKTCNPAWFTEGKIYEVVDGEIFDDRGEPSLYRYKTLDSLNKAFLSTFIKLIED